jgi:hypothetical protein
MSPNGLRLSGARKRVRCSDLLGAARICTTLSLRSTIRLHVLLLNRLPT